MLCFSVLGFFLFVLLCYVFVFCCIYLSSDVVFFCICPVMLCFSLLYLFVLIGYHDILTETWITSCEIHEARLGKWDK